MAGSVTKQMSLNLSVSITTEREFMKIDENFQCATKMLEQHHHGKISFESEENDSESTSSSLMLSDNLNEHNDILTVAVSSSENNRMRLAMGVLVRLVLPLLNSVARGWRGIRGIRILRALTNLRTSRDMLTNLYAFAANSISMSLSSVQVVHKIDPLLKMMKLRRNPTLKKISSGLTPATITAPINFPLCISDLPEKCVTLNILAEPPPEMPIRADVILIHGLHGSLVNTWKQGLWNSEGRRVKLERPPRPPIRPPKRPRHSRTTKIDHQHQSKRVCYRHHDNNHSREHLQDVLWNACIDSGEFFEDDDSLVLTPDEVSSKQKFTYVCEEPDETEIINGMEFSFPTFRLRVEDTDEEDSHHLHANNVPDKKSGKKQKRPQVTDENYSKCWPGDWLPLDCPGVRVIALNYTTDPYLWRPTWIRKRNRTSLVERSREMTDLLIEKGVGVGHPIIWVGHSKGGIFIKQIIVDAWESGRPSAAPLWRSSRGTFFYSVPHRGSPLADFNLPLLRQSIELLEIQKNCPGVLELHRRFVALYRGGHLKIRVFSFVETALTFMSVLYLRIVGVDSADPGIGEVCGVHLDHREICKPRNRNCILYTELTKMINKVS